MNSDLTSTQNVSNTNNPQGSQGTPTANDSSQFQASAGTDVLSQNRPISVISTGPPVTNTSPAGNSSSVTLFVIIATAILLITAGAVFRRMMRIPETIKEADKPDTSVAFTAVKKAPKPKQKAPIGKKKVSRSKRHK